MVTTLTAKLKLHTTPDQFRALRQTQMAYRAALNYVSRYAFAHGKLSNKVGLQEGTYLDIRALWLARADGLFGPPAGGRHLQSALDQGQGECRRPRSGSHQTTVPWAGPGAHVRLAHADLS